LKEVANGLASKDAALVGDCAEVMTMVAGEHPEWVAPYGKALSRLLASEATRVRWEATHALALIATTSPQTIASSLHRLGEMIITDASVITRDHVVDAVGNYAKTSDKAATEAYPVLLYALTSWQGKQAAHALSGLKNVGQRLPHKVPELRILARAYLDHPRGVVRQAAKSLLRSLDKL
jgi:hypothetical protein